MTEIDPRYHTDGLERLLKSLKGHVVGSVDVERKDDFLHVKMSVIEVTTERPLPRARDVSFSVMWKKTVDRMMDGYNKQLNEISSKLKELAEYKEYVEDLKGRIDP